jgi:DNA (cytosine-5)-methyltransferase 1
MERGAMPKRKVQRKRTIRRRPATRIVAVDLFCGAGGLTKGLEAAGIDVALGVDIDPSCEYPVWSKN